MQARFVLPIVALFSLTTTMVTPADRASEVESAFYQAVGDGDAHTAYDQMHSALQELVALPVLEAWSIAWRDTLGSHVSTSRTSSSRSRRLTGVQIDIESEVAFENGMAKASMRLIDNQLIAFNVQSDQLRCGYACAMLSHFRSNTRSWSYQQKRRHFFVMSQKHSAFGFRHVETDANSKGV